MTTTDHERLRELADRVEALTGPSREVDAEIKQALTGDCRHAETVNHWSPDYDISTAVCTVCQAHMPRVRLLGPDYTASLDAAMTLCSQPPSFDLDHDHERQGGKWNCLVGDAEGWVSTGRATAAAPALALTAACLRALAKENDNGQ